ncbi:AIG2 family protein [Nitrosococcus halophilus Nc 4]|uniref:AIG2 family protein n=1 Tax=Nitrosococcus halophilus (strain Nc4) TaxID=472759 RepID=D5BZG8_NITHN|nr:gamma-glutamylcyclotransferase family protein [Nitrosococcus halophilus]ADE16182.1 AIG2 family protein [Nitrosococcus halophilus Nc 4]
MSAWYFAYGANMLTDVLVRRRGIIPLSSEQARLDGYQLVFNQPGLPYIEPCFASIQPTRTDCVYGVLHHLTAHTATQIDRFEGRGYQRLMIKVEGAKSGWISAWAYQSSRPIEGRRPSRRYRDLLIAGAQEFNLPQEYIAYLKQIPYSDFPLISRLLPPLIEVIERTKRRSTS